MYVKIGNTACHAGGRGFESLPDRIEAQAFTDVWAFFSAIIASLQ